MAGLIPGAVPILGQGQKQQGMPLVHDPGNFQGLQAIASATNSCADMTLFAEACRRAYEGPGGRERTDFAEIVDAVLADFDTFGQRVRAHVERKQAEAAAAQAELQAKIDAGPVDEAPA